MGKVKKKRLPRFKIGEKAALKDKYGSIYLVEVIKIHKEYSIAKGKYEVDFIKILTVKVYDEFGDTQYTIHEGSIEVEKSSGDTLHKLTNMLRVLYG